MYAKCFCDPLKKLFNEYNGSLKITAFIMTLGFVYGSQQIDNMQAQFNGEAEGFQYKKRHGFVFQQL